jgi:uncharacterized protein YggE
MMRKLVVAAWLGLSSIVAAVPAASQVSLPPLAAGEVLLEVSAVGTVRSPATSASIGLAVSAEGASEAEARRNFDATLARVNAAARAAGVAAADIHAAQPTFGSDPYGMVGNSFDFRDFNVADAEAAANSTVAEAERFYGHAQVAIRLRNPAAAPALHRRLAEIGNVTVEPTDYALDDDSEARRQARADAIRRARADAEAYAASMNMRVARILRVTERSGTDFMSMLLGTETELMRRMEGRLRPGEEGRIETVAMIGVDFALVPR